MMSVCVPSPHNSSPSVDVANHNGPSATPPTSLSLRSPHNQLLSDDVVKQGQATPPKCRKKYALTSIQSAMGLGEGLVPPSSSSSSSSTSSLTATAANLKLVKNGANQLRKAAELQDQNKNTTNEDEVGNATSDTELFIDHELHADLDLSLESRTELDHTQTDDSDSISELAKEDTVDFVNDVDGNEDDQVQDSNTNPFEEDSDDLLILSDKTELALDRKSPQFRKAKSLLESHIDDLPLDDPAVQDDDVTKPLLKEQKNPSPPSPRKQRSPEDTPLLSVGSSSASSSPETKKDRPRTGAKTDRALNRIQNLPHSDEESSWTTLSQDSASLGSPEENGQCLQSLIAIVTVIFW